MNIKLGIRETVEAPRGTKIKSAGIILRDDGVALSVSTERQGKKTEYVMQLDPQSFVQVIGEGLGWVRGLALNSSKRTTGPVPDGMQQQVGDETLEELFRRANIPK